MEKIPESIENLTSLKYLNLSANKIRFLPEEICKLKSLKQLDLSNNYLNSLSEYLFDLTSLEILKLNGNPLGHIPEWIENLTSLKVLDIGRANLTSLSSSISQLKALQELNIELNPIPGYFAVSADWVMLAKLRIRGVKIVKSADSYYRSVDPSYRRVYMDGSDSVCPECGSGNLETDDISYWHCPDCGLNITKG